jgi:peptidoglycan/LPS O-acetylase OafA/YrhL
MFHGVLVSCTLLLVGLAVLRAPLSYRGLQPALERAAARPLVQLGHASYALYVLHVPLLRAVAARLGPGLVSACAAVGCSLFLAFAAEALAGRLRCTWLQRAYLPAESV